MRTETFQSLKTATKITVKTFLLNVFKARIVSCEIKRNEIISHLSTLTLLYVKRDLLITPVRTQGFFHLSGSCQLRV